MINTKRRALSNEKVSKQEEQTKKLKTNQNQAKVLKSVEPKVENPQKQAKKDKKATKNDLKQKVPEVKEHYEAVKSENTQEAKKPEVANKKKEQKVNKKEKLQKPKVAKKPYVKLPIPAVFKKETKLALKAKEEKKESKVATKLPVLEGLELGYVVCDPEKRFMLLNTFLRKNAGKNIFVLFSNINSVKFFDSLATQLDFQTLTIDENDSQEKKQETLKKASEEKIPVFLRSQDATLDFFKDIQVDWLLQYEPPVDAQAYLNLSNQVIKNAPETAKSLLFLLPTDLGYLRYLGASKAEFKEFEFPNHKLINIQSQCEKLIKKNFFLNCAARDAFRSYIQVYTSHPLKEIFDAKKVDLEKVVKSFGLDQLIHVHLDETSSASSKRPYQIGRKKIFGDN